MPDQYMLNFGGSALSFSGASFGWESSVVQYPYMLFEFSESSFAPTTNLVSEYYRDRVAWSQVSSSPNVWKLDIYAFALPQTQSGVGLAMLFGGQDASHGTLKSSALGGGTCKLIGSGNLDTELNGAYCTSFDRAFIGCTGLTYIEPLHCTHAINVGSMFQSCYNVTSGALDQYNWFVAYGVNVTNHSSTFMECGRDTVTGAAELAQIPVGWGGTLVPPSTLMTSARTKWFSNYDTWVLSGSTPTWTSINGMYLFTKASVSAYAGVSMNRSRIRAINGLGTASGNELYFYPCIMQHTSVITWAVVTASYNDMLASTQPNTDMAGTLDYNTYGAFTHEYGTYDSSKDVCFCFLVLNTTIDNWTGLTDKYGVLFNANFKPDASFRYFF